MCKYQLKIANLYNIPIGNVKKLKLNLLDEEKYVIHYKNLKLYSMLGIKLKKVHHVLELNQSQWLKSYVEFNTKKEKTIKIFKNRIDAKLVNTEKYYLKCT